MLGFVIASFFALQVEAGTSAPTPVSAGAPIELATALDEALTGSVSVQEAQAAVQSARAELAVLSPLLPNPEVEGGAVTDVLTGNEGELGLDVGLSQEVPFPLARLAAVAAAEARVRAAEQRLEAARIEVRADATERLIELAAAIDQARVRKDLVETAQRLADATRKRFEQGASSEADANLADIELAAASATFATTRGAVTEARARLCGLIGRKDCGDLDATFPAIDVAAIDGDAASRALQGRKDVVAAGIAVEAAERAVSAAQLGRVPPITFGVGASWERGTLEDAAGATLTDEDTLLGVRLALPLPLWDWGGGEVARARAEQATAEAELARLRRTVVVETTAAQSELAATRDARVQWRDVAPKIDQTLAWYVQGYETGATSLEDYLALRDRLVRARLAALDARRAEALASVRLLRALGTTIGGAREPSPGEKR